MRFAHAFDQFVHIRPAVFVQGDARGFRLVPHLPEYFLDNLHPNALGAEVYGRNLAEAIRKAGF